MSHFPSSWKLTTTIVFIHIPFYLRFIDRDLSDYLALPSCVTWVYYLTKKIPFERVQKPVFPEVDRSMPGSLARVKKGPLWLADACRSEKSPWVGTPASSIHLEPWDLEQQVASLYDLSLPMRAPHCDMAAGGIMGEFCLWSARCSHVYVQGLVEQCWW